MSFYTQKFKDIDNRLIDLSNRVQSLDARITQKVYTGMTDCLSYYEVNNMPNYIIGLSEM